MIIIKTGIKTDTVIVDSDDKNIYVYCSTYDSDTVHRAVAAHYWRLIKIAHKDPEHFGHLIGRIKRI